MLKAKKMAYASPWLLTYGNIAKITRNVGDKGNDDNGMGKTDKTGT